MAKAKRDPEQQDQAAESRAPVPLRQSVSRGGPAPEVASTITLDEFVRSLGKARSAGFATREKNQQPLRRTSEQWRAALQQHLRRPVR